MIIDPLRSVRPWLTFGGCVLIVAVMAWAQPVVVPVALAALLTFLLSPIVSPLQRRLGRVPAVIIVVTLAGALVGLAAWGVTRQVTALVQELPQYRQNIRQKIRDVRLAGSGGSVETLKKTVEDIKQEINPGERRDTGPDQVVVQSSEGGGIWALPEVLGPWIAPIADVGFVIALLIFMLLERQQLRDRLIRLCGRGQLPVTTRAFDEAGRRVSDYLVVQSLINATFGLGVGVGLFFIGVPHALLWGFLAAGLRFIPYVGTWIATLAPLLVALAVLEGWTRPLLVAALFAVLELLTNLVLETTFYAGVAGVSQVGLLVAIAFWTWLWGPVGLLLATPLTVCLVVIGRHVPDLEFVTTLLCDAPVLDADVRYYQRLLAGDRVEAVDLLEEHVGEHPGENVYDALMLPALNYAVRDGLDGRLDEDHERGVVQATRELLPEAAALGEERRDAAPAAQRAEREPIAILGCAIEGEADALALEMLDRLLDPAAFTMEIMPGSRLASEVIARIKEGRHRVVCIAYLPPRSASRSHRLVKRLRAAVPDLKILVGAWAPDALADEVDDAGADHVATKLVATAEALEALWRDLPRAEPAGAA